MIKFTNPTSIEANKRGMYPCIVRGELNMSRMKRVAAFTTIMKSPRVSTISGPSTSLSTGRINVFITERIAPAIMSSRNPPEKSNPDIKYAAAYKAIEFENTEKISFQKSFIVIYYNFFIQAVPEGFVQSFLSVFLFP